MTTLLMSLLAYGQSYADLFLGPSLTAFLDPSNIPAVKDRVAFECYTDAATQAILEAHPNWQRLTELVPITIHLLPPGSTVYEQRYHLQSVTFQRSLHRALKDDRALMLLTADMVHSEGFLPKMLAKLDEGHDSVQGIYLRATAETLREPLTTLGRAMTAAEMWSAGRGHIHPLFTSAHWNAPDFSNIPYWPMWVKGDHLVLRCLTITTMAVTVTPEMLKAPRNVPDAMVDPYLTNPYVIENWPEMATLQLEHLTAFFPPFRPGPSNLLEWLDWMPGAAPAGSIKNMQRTFRLYDESNPPEPALLAASIAESDAVVTEMLERSGTIPVGTKPADVPPEHQAEYAKVVDGRHGTFLVNVNDMYVGKSLVEYGEFSKEEGDRFAELVKPGMVVVEVGANIGAHTVHLAKLVGPKGGVIAIEPQRIACQMLCANVQLNSLSNVHVIPAAVGAKPGLVHLPELNPRMVNNFGGFELVDVQRGQPTPVITLDSLDRCDFLKIDCEGMEQAVLEGGQKLIARHRPIMYVENDRDDKSAALLQFIEGLGYDWTWDRPRLFSADNFKHNPVNHFGLIVSANLICRPRGKR